MKEYFKKKNSQALIAPSKVPGSSGTRNLSNNISDLKAQIAANQKVMFNYLFKFSQIYVN